MIYRSLATRPEQPLDRARPSERFLVRRWQWRGPVLVITVLGGMIGWAGLTGLISLAPTMIAIWWLLVLLCMWLFLKPQVVEIDYAARRLYSPPHIFELAEVAYARLAAVGEEGEISIVLHENGREIPIARGRRDGVAKAAKAINLALAEQYESTRLMPDGLRHAVQALDQGLPLSGFEKLGIPEQRAMLESIFKRLPIADLAVQLTEDGFYIAEGSSRGLSVKVEYRLANGRTEVSATALSPHGHLSLMRAEDLTSAADGWVNVSNDLCINGEANRISFEKFSEELRDRTGREMERLRVRYLNIDPDRVRVASHDSLRELRDPGMRLAGLLELVVAFGLELQR